MKKHDVATRIPQLPIAQFLMTLRFCASATLPPYKGSTLRGAFGTAFRRSVCTARKSSCELCLLRQRCIYSVVFETPVPEDNPLFKGQRNAPHPFVLEPPETALSRFAEGDTLAFGLTLIGDSINYLVYFVHAFQQLAKMGLGVSRTPFKLLSVSELLPDGHTGNLYDESEGKLAAPKNVRTLADIISLSSTIRRRSITVDFVTPTRLQYDGSLVEELTFPVFWAAVSRRVSLLCSLYAQFPCSADWDYLHTLSHQVSVRATNVKWFDWERYSKRQGARMPLGGLKGAVEFEGPLSAFMPWLAAGQILHVGKNSAFGLGKYRIHQEE